MGSITAANAVIVLSVAAVFPAAQLLQGFAVDDIYDSAELAPTEAMMGVDGRLSAGAINVPIVQTFQFMADSVSNDVFEAWAAAMKRDQEVYFAQMTIVLPSRGKEYTHGNGSLTGSKALPGAGKVLRPRSWQITWESVVPSNV